MGRNKKYIPIVKDREHGNWAYRGASREKETRKRYQELRKQGIPADSIDIVPVKSSGLGFSDILGILNVACTIFEVYVFLKGKRENKV